MQIVIDINEDIYKARQHWVANSKRMVSEVDVAIANGTPLPKGHGELIDRDKIEYLKAIHDAKYGYITWSDAIARIKYSAPTIIEADKKESDE